MIKKKSLLNYCGGVNKRKSTVKTVKTIENNTLLIKICQKQCRYIFLHIKRNCEIFIFKCAKIMKIVRIHILIQKNFHVIRLKNEA